MAIAREAPAVNGAWPDANYATFLPPRAARLPESFEWVPPNWFGFDGGSSVAEGRRDRLHQALSLKRILSGKKGEIVEVFHSAVEETERRQRFQFLGDDRLFDRRGTVAGKSSKLGYSMSVGPGVMTSPNPISSCTNSRSRERCVELDSDTLVIRVLFDSADLD